MKKAFFVNIASSCQYCFFVDIDGIFLYNKNMKKKRRKKWTRFRHRFVFAVFRPFFWFYMRLKYGFRYQKYRLPKGPALILFNHPTNMDPIMTCLSIPGPIYFIATDDIFSIRFWSPVIRYLVAPISKSKAVIDIQTIRNCMRIVKEGGRIGLSPEGNRTYNGALCHINPAVVKMIRLLKIPLVFYNITGGYGVHPRFSPHLRKGRITGKVRTVMTPEEYLPLSDEELYRIVVENLTVDEFGSGRKYKSKKRAEKLESALFVCPVCHGVSTLYSEKHHCYCRECGLAVEYTEEVTLRSSHPDFHFNTVREWDIFQREFFLKNKPASFSDFPVELKKIILNKFKEHCLEGRLSIDETSLTIENDMKKIVFALEKIVSVALLGQNKINFYHGDDIYQLRGDHAFNALKYIYYYHVARMQRQGVEDDFLGI